MYPHRTLIRKGETKEVEAYAVEGELKEACVALDADVIFIHMCPVGKDIIEQATALEVYCYGKGGVENIAGGKCKEKESELFTVPCTTPLPLLS